MYCTQNLKTPLLVVMGFSNCGALKGAVASIPAAEATTQKQEASVPENYLVALTPAATQAKARLPRAPIQYSEEREIRINVKNTEQDS
mmetsp:Transcript_116617/g.232508  ORF Transcript_116617/g.232508 Transcript_116617/m.232508 type:complete len:88 (+) Transcript_116617:313-576(+)